MLANHRGQGTRGQRRGVTLVEMLVTVAVLVIIMTILVQIFQAATGSVTAAQALQQLDDQLRRIDTVIRNDLNGVTARFTPPLDPLQNLGYFEYGENEFADNQGEDSDDYIRFTAKAPAGQPFTGRFWPNFWYNATTNQTFLVNGANISSYPITLTSDYAEIIYFVRNGNLYRRVFLIVPDIQSAIVPSINNLNSLPNGNTYYFQPQIFGGPNSTPPGPTVSWQGVNDLSARPAASGNTANTIVLNTLGDLTQRENRAFMPRFGNDFWNATSGAAGQDGIPDDVNGDNVPDLYPSLYPNIVNNPGLVYTYNYPANGTITSAASLLAFPYVFPGAYSKAQAQGNTNVPYGWIHTPSPLANSNGTLVPFDTGGLNYVASINHNPLDTGDNLPTPISPTIQHGGTEPSMLQTWWGFPTWRETLSPNWNDPTLPVWSGSQPNGLSYVAMNINPAQGFLTPTNGNLLPPMADPANFTGNFSIFRQSQQLFCDAAGQNSAFWGGNSNLLWAQSWEDDLIMTGVRSFDVKTYDIALTNYADLGWGDDLRLYLPYQNAPGFLGYSAPPYIAGVTATPFGTNLPWPPINPNVNPYTPVYSLYNTFAHEGRMPPLINDGIYDWQYGQGTYSNPPNNTYTGNIGDNTPGIVRLRRVWDTWSYEYSRAPGTGVGPPNTGNFPIGPPWTPPVYPSYPPPYQAPLRGLQIQIRVVDPTNQRIKSLTIRQDFTDKL